MLSFNQFLSERAQYSGMTYVELVKWGKTIVDKLSPTEIRLLRAYTNNAYEDINGFLRGGPQAMSRWKLGLAGTQAKTTDAHARIMAGFQQKVDAIFPKFKIPGAVTVYRGAGPLPAFDRWRVGNVITFPGYLSTTMDISVALDFTQGVLLQIEIPARKLAIPISAMRTLSWESEMLLPHHTSLKLLEPPQLVTAEKQGTKERLVPAPAGSVASYDWHDGAVVRDLYHCTVV